MKTLERVCSEDGCDRPLSCRGWCKMHYARHRRAGLTPRPVADRFLSLVEKTDECWLWTGALTSFGYGQFSWRKGGRRTWQAHRVAYELFVAPIPDGLELDHLCRVRHCVNPTHLEPVTKAENRRRGAGKGGVLYAPVGPSCRRGHSDFYLTSRGRWRCRECRRDGQRKHRQKLAK